MKARIKQGKGIVTRILTILEGIPFGDFYFEIGVLLRNALLVSSMLCNSEAWWNVTKTELDLLETIDVKFLRNTKIYCQGNVIFRDRVHSFQRPNPTKANIVFAPYFK